MSNPFKSDNNRFKLLDDRNSSIPFENKKKKEDRETRETRETKENRFLSSRDQHIIRNSYNERRNLKNANATNVDLTKVGLEINFEESFPEMNKTKSTAFENSSTLDFKSLINKKEVEVPIVETNIIKPGTIILSYEKNKIIAERGQLTEWETQKMKELFYKSTPHYIMTNAIYKMEEFWELHENVYDEINGEGSYNEKFNMEPIYNSDYEDDSEEDDIEDESNYSDEY